MPILVAIDEHGIVRSVRPRPETFAAEFLDRHVRRTTRADAEVSGPPGHRTSTN